MRVGTFGLARKHILGHVAAGDPIVCCAGKGDWKIIAVGSASSDYYVDDSQIFLKKGFFVDRFDFQCERLSPDKEIDVMSIIDQLTFVKNLAYWAVFFRSGIARMTKQDWDLIRKLANNSLAASH